MVAGQEEVTTRSSVSRGKAGAVANLGVRQVGRAGKPRVSPMVIIAHFWLSSPYRLSVAHVLACSLRIHSPL
jgi:hypothetical protein